MLDYEAFKDSIPAPLRKVMTFIIANNVPNASHLGKTDIGDKGYIGKQVLVVPFLELLYPVLNKDISWNDYEYLAIG